MTLPDEHLRIDTPENVAFDYEVAGIGSRFMAALLDTLLILILQVLASLAMGLMFDLFGSSLEGWWMAVLGLISFAFLWGYYVFFELLWNGQSPGKRLAGLRVIRTDGTPISLAESIIRNLVRLVDFMPFFYGVGVVTMFVNEQARRLGDLAAGTLVVRDRPEVTLESLAAGQRLPTLRQQSSHGAADWPVERLTPQDIQMAEDFLARREQLSNRSGIASQIAQALLGRMGMVWGDVGVISSEDIIAKTIRMARGEDQRVS